MNRYHMLKAGLIGAALCFAVAAGSIGPAAMPPRLSHSPFSAADTAQAGLYRAGAQLGHFALRLFYFAR